jgi:16S rRNA (guanine966-N2)-methyltransferase
MLTSRLGSFEDLRVADLFAGSGALGFEALSRGAAFACFVESDARAAATIKANAAALDTVADVQVLGGSALTLPRSQAFDLILADPPYGEKNVSHRSTSFAQKLLDDPSLPKLLAPGGRFALGHASRDKLEIPAPWREVKLLKHGDSVMRFFEV